MIKELLSKKDHITINFIGDSITQGTSHCHPEETYVARVAELIAKDFSDCKVVRYDAKKYGPESHLGQCIEEFDTPIYVNVKGEKQIDVIRNGIGGSTVAFALHQNRIGQIKGEMPNGRHADVFVMMYGINDALSSDPKKYVPSDEYKANYKTLINEIREENPDAKLVVVTTSPNGFLGDYITKAQEVAKEENLPLIDLYKHWTDRYVEGAPNHGYSDWLSNVSWDACHHSPLGAYESALFVYKKLKEL